MNNKDVLIISVLTFITVLVWIFFDAYHVYTTSTIPAELKVQLEPLRINISWQDIQNLKNRPEFFPILTTPSAQASPSGESEASPSGESY